MPDKLSTPEYWYERAEEARILGESMKDPEAKRAMLTVAENYERSLCERKLDNWASSRR